LVGKFFLSENKLPSLDSISNAYHKLFGLPTLFLITLLARRFEISNNSVIKSCKDLERPKIVGLFQYFAHVEKS